MVTISTRVRRLDAICSPSPSAFETSTARSAPIRINADEEDGIPPDELIALTKHPKVVALGEAGLDYFYDNGSPEAQARGFRAHIAAARATGLPLVIHTREADDDCGRILEEEAAKGPFTAVLHCYTGGRELALKAVALGLYDRLHRHPDLQEVAGRCAPSRPSCRPTVFWSKPTRRILRPASTAASATSRPMWSRPRRCWPKPAACRSTRSRARPRKTSSACSPRCKLETQPHDADADDPGLRLLRRRAAPGARLGRLRSQQSEEPPPPLLAAGRADVRRTASRASLIDTSPDLREQLIDANVDHHRRGVPDPRACRPDPRHGRSALGRPAHAPAHSGLLQPVDRARHHGALRLLLHRRRQGSDYPPILDAAFDRGRREPDDRREGRRADPEAFLVQHGNIPALGYRIGNAAYTPDLNDIPRESWGALEDLDLWIIDGLRYASTPAISASTTRCPGSSASSRSRAVITNMTADVDDEAIRQTLPAGVVPAL